MIKLYDQSWRRHSTDIVISVKPSNSNNLSVHISGMYLSPANSSGLGTLGRSFSPYTDISLNLKAVEASTLIQELRFIA